MSEWSRDVVLAKSGDTEAFGSLVRQFQHMAIGYAYSILGNFDQAEDAVQSAFVEAYQSLPNLREPMAFPAWLRKIVFKHCDRLTRGRRIPTVSLEQAMEIPSHSPDPPSLVERRELQSAVLNAIGSLPENERAATTLFYINGYSQSEVAGFLDVPVTTLKNWLHGARGRLREGMLDMVEETLKNSAPGEEFCRSIRAKIENLRWVHRWLTHLGCLEGCLSYLGLDLTPAWLAGGAGYAFAMRVHTELCPAGIIAWAPPDELAPNVGYRTQGLAPQDDNVAKQQQIVWSAANKALDRGMPVIGFAMEAWQSYIIYGYDDDGYFYQPVHTGDGHFLKAKMGVDVPCVVTFIERTDRPDDVTVVKDALSFAIRFATDPSIAPGWAGPPDDFAGGLAGYGMWIDSLESGRADGHGMGFNAQVYAELRHMAAEFLKESAERLDMRPEFSKAVCLYRLAASHLKSVAELFPLPADPAHIQDGARCRTAIETLGAAQRAEEEGVEALRTLLSRL